MARDTTQRRVFVAVPISPELQDEIARWEARYHTLNVRWLAGKNLHVTLVPPWYEENIERVKEALASIREKFGSFEIQFERVTFGPDPQRPRLVWAKGEALSQITELRSRIMEALGARPEARPFRLHLTLARFREEEFASFPIQQLGERVVWRDHIRSLVLMESHLSPGGADYEMLEKFPLGV